MNIYDRGVRSKMVNLVKLSCITNVFLVKSFLRKIDINQVYVEDNNLIHSYMSFILENYWSIYTIQKIQYKSTGYFQKSFPKCSIVHVGVYRIRIYTRGANLMISDSDRHLGFAVRWRSFYCKLVIFFVLMMNWLITI